MNAKEIPVFPANQIPAGSAMLPARTGYKKSKKSQYYPYFL